MSISLIISDIHGRTQIADKLLASIPHDRAIFLGDFFDFVGDNYFDAIKIAAWVKNQLDNNLKFITAIGNHDAGPMFPYSTCRQCSGFTQSKSDAINSILTQKDWRKFLPYYYHEEGNWMLSHAGLDPQVFSEPLRENLDALKGSFDMAFAALDERGGYHPYFAAGRDRGGSELKGGVTWCDFNSINPVKQWNQIVGHTRLSAPKIKYRESESKYLKVKEFNNGMVSQNNPNRLDNGDIVCGLDSDNHHYGLITDGILTIHETPKEFFTDYQKEKDARKLNDLMKLYDSMPKFQL